MTDQERELIAAVCEGFGPSADGRVVLPLAGSRGVVVAVRVHRWFDGVAHRARPWSNARVGAGQPAPQNRPARRTLAHSVASVGGASGGIAARVSAAALAEAGEEVVDFEKLPSWNLARVALSHLDGRVRSLLVKWPRTNVEREVGLGFLRTEIAALGYVNGIDSSLAPRLAWATDDLFAVEDLGHGRWLWDLLRAGDPRAADAYRDFARVMARLHTSTVGMTDRWNDARRRAGLAPADPDPEAIDVSRWEWNLSAFEAVGIDARPSAQVDLDRVRSTLTRPGPFLAFSNGDPGANNFVATDGGGRLIDFEYARCRHALVDAACLHVQHSVWMTIADPTPFGVVNVYRTELAKHIPEAEDDALFFDGIAGAAAMRAVQRLQRFAKLDARPEGDESRRQMVATLDAARTTLAGYRVLSDLGGWLEDVAATLRRRWPDADVAFPAFTVR